MKILVVIEGNFGDESEQYHAWLLNNLPECVELEFRADCVGVGGGLYDDNGDFVDDGMDWWEAYCNE